MLRFLLALAIPLAGSSIALAQGQGPGPSPEEQTPPTEQPERPRGQVALGLGPFGLQGDLSVALRVAGPWSLGGGLGFGWEEHLHELETDLLALAHAQLFVRHQDLEELFVDLGVTAGRYDRVDDRAGDCSHATCGWMAGLYVEPNLGYRWVFAALRLRLVLADDLSKNRFTFVLTPMIRGLIS